ncbi:MAG: hypothetical protein COX77_01400 [Candidatus Komeilibacteria bacterium CG_4_10_14_0_2_um_filter_37_10]|uniref:DUF5667 domain-containing protein n=1 Tax=Candidatus Komeilibacteria bacterium CG_4_10_14_0_2_um_filter_37_10 TaxID=1974470 RepID=A0A2M7VFR4_9BACT|nr:MAG: hypothetical protein COX77_01400 [Candidatus Komeilibacteria bacterium CG_4_10_14_0_2_um_filter_37_10]PJA93874.1 MAG: hypothetical protein CO133_00920 [Candidatus Komeilibacteria bacterium CG_4_9_14_3_um_filter_37_5]
MDILIDQLNKMKSTGPDQAWVVSCREKVLSHIECSSLTIGQRIMSRLNISGDYLLLSPVKVLTVLFLTVIIFSSSLMAKASLPGSIFYPSRVIIERVELLLATNSISEAKILNKHLRQKLSDLKQLASQEGDGQNVQGMAKRIEQDLSAAITSLDIAKTETNSDSELGQVALDINDNIKNTSAIIQEAKTENINPETMTVLNEVLQSTASAEDKTLQLLVKMYNDNQITAEETVSKLIAIINDQLIKASEQIQLRSTQVADDDRENSYGQIRTAGNMLQEARKLAAEKQYSLAADKLSQIKELINKIELK